MEMKVSPTWKGNLNGFQTQCDQSALKSQFPSMGKATPEVFPAELGLFAGGNLGCFPYYNDVKPLVNNMTNNNETALGEAGLNRSEENRMGESLVLILSHQM
ncbi:oxysterol-binding protein 2 [Platysternon megacephalum]|uniref:Oxysterol-binding protein 2 n=1 Tax=Platysternon megacephalum TaxID=55544 RepID=A0A4D9DIB8_9SAUR|nr:oxysterol-binding protein 2 [Platysternon megacephalum]